MSVSRGKWLTLYRELLRTAAAFPQYNFRSFAQRRVREQFRRERGAEADEAALYAKGVSELAALRRQTTLGSLLTNRPLVIEPKPAAH